ncbi:hypothetical protein BRD18_08890 [Halobacteriales archaeon SW_7_71_33]|nr:MAG: hypothetical protein BRD18_08890 [Halobacteriales archaeon SW_7_71_33]
MQYEARGLLEELVEPVVDDSVTIVEQHYSNYPGEVQAVIAVERAEGKLDGVYTMWLIANDADRADDAVSTINDIVSPYSRAIQDNFA